MLSFSWSSAHLLFIVFCLFLLLLLTLADVCVFFCVRTARPDQTSRDCWFPYLQCTLTDMEIWIVYKVAFPFGHSRKGIVCATRLGSVCLEGIDRHRDLNSIVDVRLWWSTISLSPIFRLTKIKRKVLHLKRSGWYPPFVLGSIRFQGKKKERPTKKIITWG